MGEWIVWTDGFGFERSEAGDFGRELSVSDEGLGLMSECDVEDDYGLLVIGRLR